MTERTGTEIAKTSIIRLVRCQYCSLQDFKEAVVLLEHESIANNKIKAEKKEGKH